MNKSELLENQLRPTNLVIEAIKVSKSFKGNLLYSDVTFGIETGSIAAIIGANGSGKSVLLKMICGFSRPKSGDIWVRGQRINAWRWFPENFGILIDRPAFQSNLSGFDNLNILASIRGVIGEAEIRFVMEKLGLDSESKLKMAKYSLGMKQKISIAQAIMESPDVLILDEPFNALDDESVSTVKSILKSLNNAGVTIVFTSHNQKDITDLATQILTIHENCVTNQVV